MAYNVYFSCDTCGATYNGKPHGFTIYCREDCEKLWMERWETWVVLPGVSEEEEEERKCLTNTSAARRH